MRLTVDYSRCQGHTLCAWSAPDVIRLGEDDGRAIVDNADIDPEHADAVRRAAANCPEGALVIEE